jgi:single-stranded DNA-specific DHH superfamily exonuclease
VVDLNQVDDALWIALEQIAPFGMDNCKPLFAVRGAALAGPPQVWKEKHIRIAVRQGRRTVMMKGWNMGALAADLKDAKTVDIAFEIEKDFFGSWGLTAKACRISFEPAPAA